jgi:hypothetical protein
LRIQSKHFCLLDFEKIKKYETIILPVVLYGCETWSLTLRVECRLRVFENKILGRIFGPKRDGSGSDEVSAMKNFIVCIVSLI